MNHERVSELAKAAGPAVVGLAEGARGGSGVVTAPGRVVTLARNLRGNEATVAFAGGRRENATVRGSDSELGVALLEVDTGDAPAISWRDDPQAPPIGAPVLALADPAGRGLHVTAGAVASAPQSLRGPRGRMLEGLIEHTAPLPRGSAGGPLLDGDGKLLGLNTVRLAYGLILALPAAAMRARVDELEKGGTRVPRRLGVAIVPPRSARRLRSAVGLPERDGVLVRGVQDESPAERAGIERGDLIVSLNGREVDSLDALFGALDAAPIDEPVALSVVRGAEQRDLTVSLEPR
jgi:serine protease Do